MLISHATRTGQFANFWLVAAVLASLGSGPFGCASRPIRPGSSLGISAEEFRGRVSMLCLSKIVSEFELEEAEAKKARLEELLTQELRKLDLSVVDSGRVAALWDEVKEDRGGYFDIHWGSVIAGRRDSIREEFYSAAFARLGCDAMLDMSIVGVESVFRKGYLRWDHATAPASYTPSPESYWFIGYLPAVSLRISIQDAPGHEIYYGAGGIHLSATMKKDEHGDFNAEPVSSERYLAFETENLNALRLALRELSIELANLDRPLSSK